MSVLPSVEYDPTQGHVNEAFENMESRKDTPPPAYTDVVVCATPAVYNPPAPSQPAPVPPAPAPATSTPATSTPSARTPAARTPPAATRERPPRPPDSDSLCGKIKIAQWESTSCLDFYKRVVMIFLQKYGFPVLLVVMSAPPISMIVIGGVYSSEEHCPISSMIYVYLLVWGVFGLIRTFLAVIQLMGRINGNVPAKSEEEKKKEQCWMALFYLFLVGWLIAGSVFIFPFYYTRSAEMYIPKPTNMAAAVNTSALLNVSTTTITTTTAKKPTKIPPGMEQNPDYCNPTLYMYAFVATLIIYGVVVLVVLLFCCWLIKLGATRK
ncbi:uncharacterized protein LOC106162078 [Lingula anatina]|uniref:Uncharacterized protein LOC106162078 n=1 Tax=Lingula anatina TaxID=7574 RepID=A0A1S3I8Z3_LINAN|nr:uncharacterized protein LOC106162078 [Lingula anatina]|eukprot:XP_013394658.1 uncharacterized protein LOC106162078 [Lingula anatina]